MVEELAKFDGSSWDASTSISKVDLCKHALACKEIYESQYSKLEGDSSPVKNLKMRGSGKSSDKKKAVSKYEADCDSDETIEMTEDEIDNAFQTITSSFTDAG